MKKLVLSIFALFAIYFPCDVSAAQLRVFVSEMNVIGASNRDEMKLTLQALLSARLSNDKIISVAAASEADAVVSGTYIAIGKIYSMDAIAKTVSGRTLVRSSIQGEVKDELIPAIGSLAEKLSSALVKVYEKPADPAGSPKMFPPAAVPKADFILKGQAITNASTSDFIKPRDYEQGATGGWVSKRLEGAFNLMTFGSNATDGSRTICLAEDRKVSLYSQGREMKLLSEIELKANEKIISLDSLTDADGDKIFLTVIRDGEPASQIWTVKDGKFIKIAGELPWLFRSIALAGAEKKLYVQSVGREEMFFGPVYEAALTGKSITTKKTISMPRFGNLYMFNQFKTSDGAELTAVINPDDYLIVYNHDHKELWRSNDKFGGSELYFQKEDVRNMVQNGGQYQWYFMNQPIQVTSKGEILIGKNDGAWNIGNARKFKKGAVYNMVWNGSSLEEKWRTKDTQNYMPTYYFDEGKNELLMLQTVQRNGIVERGASSLSIKKVE